MVSAGPRLLIKIILLKHFALEVWVSICSAVKSCQIQSVLCRPNARLLCVDDTKDMIHFLLIYIVNSVVKYCVVCEYISTKHAIVSGISFMKI